MRQIREAIWTAICVVGIPVTVLLGLPVFLVGTLCEARANYFKTEIWMIEEWLLGLIALPHFIVSTFFGWIEDILLY